MTGKVDDPMGEKRGRGLNAQRRRFIEEYLIDLNAAAACVRAGYSSKGANVTGSQLLAIASVKSEVEKRLAERASKMALKAERVLLELARIAFSDIGALYDKDGGLLDVNDIDEDTRRAVLSVESLINGGNPVRKYKMHDKVRALQLCMQHLGIDGAKKVELTGADGGPVSVEAAGVVKLLHKMAEQAKLNKEKEVKALPAQGEKA